MKEITIISRTIPAKPRSANYPISSPPSGGGGTVSVSPGESAGIDIIKTGDSTAFSDTNVLSSLRANDEFINRKKDSSVTAVVDYLKGLKINGVPVTRILNKDTEEGEFSDTDIMSALRVIAEIAAHDEELKKMFLRKDQADGTPFPMTFGDWVKFGEFITGISGGCIDKNGILEMEEGIFRKRLFVPEIAYNRVTYFKGRMCASPGGGCTVKDWTDNGDGSYTITPDLTDADGLSQFVDDILTTYFVTKNAEGKLQGFEEMKFRVTSADYTAKTFVMTPKPGTDWKPGDAMVLAQTGNFTDPERQTYILIDTVGGNNCITFFDHANTWGCRACPGSLMDW